MSSSDSNPSPKKDKKKNRPNSGKEPTRGPSWGIVFWISLLLLVYLALPEGGAFQSQEKGFTLKNLEEDLNRFNVQSVQLFEGKVQWDLAPDGLPEKEATQKTANILMKPSDELVSLINANVPSGLEHVPPNFFMTLLTGLLPWILFFVIFYFLFFRQMRGGGGGGLFNFGKSKARLVSPDMINKTFKDVAGVDEAKEELSEVVEFLKDPAKFTRLGGRLPRGVLLNGPPGTGKTLLAKAIAGEAGVPYYSISGSDFVEMFVGVGASRVRDLFQQAKENSPSIIFLDEIDAVGRKRGSGLGGGHDEREQTLNAILVEMDGFGSDDGVIVVASTNRVDVLDPALLRPGRFDRHVSVGLPDIEGRKAILKVHARKIKMHDDVNVDIIAQGTPGFSGAELENVLNEAALIAVSNEHDAVCPDDIEAARDKVAFGKEKKSPVLYAEDLKLTAYHECGHAIVSLKVPKSTPLHKLTIIPRGNALGAAFYFPERDELNRSHRQLLSEISICYGGRIAEEIFFGDVTTGAYNDIQKATSIARKMVTEFGMNEKMGLLNYQAGEDRMFLGGEISKSNPFSDDTADRIDQEILAITQKCYEEARSIIEENRDLVVHIAEKLLVYETLTGDEIRTLMDGREIERKPPINPIIKTFDANGKTSEATSTEEPEASDSQEGTETPTEPLEEEGVKPSLDTQA
jgi:cell division protease FtsH